MPDIRATYTTCQTLTVLNKAIDTAALSRGCFHDLGSLFKAIRITSERDTVAYELAGIGQYLAEDWSNTLDCEHEALSKLRKPAKNQTKERN